MGRSASEVLVAWLCSWNVLRSVRDFYQVRERIALGNKAFFANKKIFQSKFISKKAKLKLYFSIIRPVVTYACETWILKETITNRLMVFERKIFGTTYENGFWRIKTNQELDKIIKHKSKINFARAQRLEWYGHIERMRETRVVKAIHPWKPISKRPTGRPKRYAGRMMLKKIYRS